MGELILRFKPYVPDALMGIFRWGRAVAELLWGVIVYVTAGKTSQSSYLAMLTLHCRTNGGSTDLLAKFFSTIYRPESIQPVTGVLGNLDAKRIDEIVSTIRSDGYYVFETTLSDEICAEIAKFAATTPAHTETVVDGKREKRVFDPNSPVSHTYKLDEGDSIQQPVIQRLMADASIRTVAEAYINADPVLCSVNVWWSPVFGDKPGEDAAQLYHFDFSRSKWLNFFIYMTDVDSDSGPHCYVRGSHKLKSAASDELLKRGYVRIPDQDVAAAYGPENVLELTGRRGTILAVDTRGFHKGKLPTTRHRLIFELVYANCLFGGEYSNQHVDSSVDPALATALRDRPRTYRRYLDSAHQ